MRLLKYIELKTGYDDNGPAWIARVEPSRSGRTVYFDGKALKRGAGVAGNYFDPQTGDEYWISGVKKRGTNRHWAGSGKILVEAAAVPDLLQSLGTAVLDSRLFEVTHSIRQTEPAEFVALENERPED